MRMAGVIWLQKYASSVATIVALSPESTVAISPGGAATAAEPLQSETKLFGQRDVELDSIMRLDQLYMITHGVGSPWDAEASCIGCSWQSPTTRSKRKEDVRGLSGRPQQKCPAGFPKVIDALANFAQLGRDMHAYT